MSDVEPLSPAAVRLVERARQLHARAGDLAGARLVVTEQRRHIWRELNVVHRLTYKEIAKLMGCSAKTIGNELAKAKDAE